MRKEYLEKKMIATMVALILFGNIYLISKNNISAITRTTFLGPVFLFRGSKRRCSVFST